MIKAVVVEVPGVATCESLTEAAPTFWPSLPRYLHQSTGPGRWRQVAQTGEGPSPSAKVPDCACDAFDSEATVNCEPRHQLATSKPLAM